MIRILGPAPRTPLEAAARLESLLVALGLHAGYSMAPRRGHPLRRTCRICRHAQESDGGVSFTCPVGHRRSTYGAADPCDRWSPAPDVLIFDEDTGTAYVAERGDGN